jgi:50S ribosomal subunit-associated GTPase HflX
MNLIDRISSGFNRLADRTNQALDEGRLRMELARVRRRKDQAARDLGYLVYNERNKGTKPAEGETDFLVRRIADAETEMAKLDQQVNAIREARRAPAAATAAADATGDGGAGDAAPPSSAG